VRRPDRALTLKSEAALGSRRPEPADPARAPLLLAQSSTRPRRTRTSGGGCSYWRNGLLRGTLRSMLMNLLPGFRELRAPLAAGYLWLIVPWILWTPTCEDSELTMSACELNSAFSDVGLGALAIASFAAYLLGALSITFCSLPLRRWLQVGGVRRHEHLRPVSARADRYLQRLATETVERLSLALGLTETSLTEVLDEVLDEEVPRRSRRWPWQRRPDRSAAVLRADSPAPVPEEAVHRDRLVSAMARELDDIVLTRLLGRDPELFSAIDRRRAEVDFRLAIIPPLVAVLAVVASGVPVIAGIAVAAGAVLFVAALGWDALASQRKANEDLTAAIADGRVRAPALERVEAEVTARIGRTKLDEMRAAAGGALNAMRKAVKLAGEVDSAPSRVEAARKAVRDARGHLTRVEATFPAAVGEIGGDAIEAIDGAVLLWEEPARRDGMTDWGAESRRMVGQSKRFLSDFHEAILMELEREKASSRLLGSGSTSPRRD